jgi:hypothetical protein
MSSRCVGVTPSSPGGELASPSITDPMVVPAAGERTMGANSTAAVGASGGSVDTYLARYDAGP